MIAALLRRLGANSSRAPRSAAVLSDLKDWTSGRGARPAVPWASSSMAEQRTFNPRVVGSNPTGPTQ
jgi:hypothetical protein